jgi:hypothetical protein
LAVVAAGVAARIVTIACLAVAGGPVLSAPGGVARAAGGVATAACLMLLLQLLLLLAELHTVAVGASAALASAFWLGACCLA